MELLLTGCLQRGDRAAVEGVVERDDLRSALAVLVIRILARELNHALVGLRAGVGKEHLAHAGLGAQLLCDLDHRRGGIQVGYVQQLACLLGQGCGDFRVGIAEAVDADSGGQVDILLALHVPERRALAVIQSNRKPTIGIHDVLILVRLEFLISH